TCGQVPRRRTQRGPTRSERCARRSLLYQAVRLRIEEIDQHFLRANLTRRAVPPEVGVAVRCERARADLIEELLEIVPDDVRRPFAPDARIAAAHLVGKSKVVGAHAAPPSGVR